MDIGWRDIAFEPGAAFSDGVAETWRWLTDRNDLKPFMCSKFGDVFCTDITGQVHWLSCAKGDIHWIAPNRETFDSVCTRNGDRAGEWFAPRMVEQLHSEGKVAGPGEAYMFITLPIFEQCTLAPDNFKVVPADEVFIGLSEVQHLYRQMPDAKRAKIGITQ